MCMKFFGHKVGKKRKRMWLKKKYLCCACVYSIVACYEHGARQILSKIDDEMCDRQLYSSNNNNDDNNNDSNSKYGEKRKREKKHEKIYFCKLAGDGYARTHTSVNCSRRE